MTAVTFAESLALRSREVEELLGILANRRRLLILCYLIAEGELAVGELARRIDLAQSALSQHLALMRHAGVVSTRREGTTIYYSLADSRTRALIEAIEDTLLPE
ncbi:MAG: metalloregulator ArsR/SmtB family transcription factor [Proteobacteria bacterium]|nr:metalloregulator ArsR/SmtB family transcription factor [Pseudomonadota bacterium]